MEWLYSLFIEHSALQAVVVLSLISVIRLRLGRIRVCDASLSITLVFFTGVLAGHFGLSVNPQILNYTESLGFVIFAYTSGSQVGPGFLSSFRKGGVTLNMFAIAMVILDIPLTVVRSHTTEVSLPSIVGILCSATTSIPTLGVAQQALKQMGLENSTPTLRCIVVYPLGVIGVILAVLLIRKLSVRHENPKVKERGDVSKTYIAALQVYSPAIFDKSIRDIAHMSYSEPIISRSWRDGSVSISTFGKIIKESDRLLVITSEEDTLAFTVLLGEQESTDRDKRDIDWSAIDGQLVSQRIVVTRPELGRKKLRALRPRDHCRVNISRIYRSGMQLLATPEPTLWLGDHLTTVGETAAIQNVEEVLGNAVESLKGPNFVAVFVGTILGSALGAVSFSTPGISTPIRLGLAGGPTIMDILVGTLGPRLYMTTYTARSTNPILYALGLSLYLACLGLDVSVHFSDAALRPEGLLWIGLDFSLTVVLTVFAGFFAFKIMRIDFGSVSGMLCNSMVSLVALNYADDIIPGGNPSIARTTVYPLSMPLHAIIAQVLLIFLLQSS